MCYLCYACAMNKKILAQKILDLLQTQYPDAGTMLKFSSTFELLVAVVLSAQSTDAQVNKVTTEMFKKYNTPHEFASMDIAELEELVRGVGIYKNKAKAIKGLSKVLLDRFNGEVPGKFDDLMQLPGVGRKTANVMMAVGFNQPGLGVDTHVHRVANRLGLVMAKNPDQTELSLKKIIPVDRWSKAHHLFIFHGRRVCTARKPGCGRCVVEALCQKVIK